MNKEPKNNPAFLFLGNQLALDFLNTRPMQDGQFLELLPNFNSLLRWFEVAGLLSHRQAENLQRRWGESSRAHQTFEAARRMRENLRKEVLAWERGMKIRHATINELNQLMSDHPMRTSLRMAQNSLAKELWFDAERPEDLFAPLADSAATLFTEVSRDRVRKCAQCVLHFLDTSKKGTRRWCSMQLCGNRLKVAAYAARRRR